MEETFPDVSSMSDQELKELIEKLTDEEREISYRRRLLHGKIDILRAELVNRLRAQARGRRRADQRRGRAAADGHPARQGRRRRRGRATPERRRRRWPCTAQSAGSSTPRGPTTARSAAPTWRARRARRQPTTMAYKVGETGEYAAGRHRPRRSSKAGAALVIRSGGGRAGESFTIDGDRVSIGRTPDAAVFLDDVTVSRNHALLVRRRDGLYIDDLGSLNGTYVNRRRIESHRLEDGDEIQIGKYKLSYLER